MSRKLTPLEALDRLKCFKTLNRDYEFEIIETALKNYQELLEKPCVIMGRTQGNTQAFIDTISKNYKEIKITNLVDEKKLKAFKIIVEKEIDIWLLKVCDYENYCRIRTKCLETNVESMADCDKPAIPLPSQEEFDFLKEMLK